MSYQDSSDSSAFLIIFFGLACFFVLVIGITAAFYIVALTRKASDAVRNKPRNVRALITTLAPYDVYNRLLQVALAAGYKIEDITPDSSRITLGTSLTFFSYGFFYPIYLYSLPNGGTMLEVGIVSRSFQWGPVVTHNHDKCITMVRNATGASYAPQGPPAPATSMQQTPAYTMGQFPPHSAPPSNQITPPNPQTSQPPPGNGPPNPH